MSIDFEKFYKVLCCLKNMKREVVLVAGLFLILSLAGFASAACAPNQTIMQLSATTLSAATNVHGALWNQSYATKVCYTDLFKPAYSGTGNYHECTSTDWLLNLTDVNNSHASRGSSATYNIPVCYKGLKNCRIGDCPSGSTNCTTIVAIAGTGAAINNSHLWHAVQGTLPGYSKISCDCTSSNCERKIVQGCRDLAEESCDSSADAIAQMDNFCIPTNKSLCHCAWNDATDKCAVTWSGVVIGPTEATTCRWNCTITGGEYVTECSGNSRIMKATAITSLTPGSPAGCYVCQNLSSTVSCGGVDTNLPFFGAWQVVSSLIAISLFYALLKRKRLL